MEREKPIGEEEQKWRTPKLTGKEAPGTRLVLGFDGGCSACSELARRIEERLPGQLEVLSLHEPEVEEWRKQALGEGVPLVPTLFEIREPEVRAWTGWRLGAALGRFLGPFAAWRVMQALGEAPDAKEPPVVGVVGGLTRGQFLKGVGGAAVALSVLSTTGKLVSPAGAEERSTGRTASASDEAVGASIVHPAEWSVERERYTFDDTYGFTLWKPEPGSSQDHGGTPAVRVALAYGLRPGQIKARVLEKLRAYPDLAMSREEVTVAEKGHRGVAVGPIPGSTPSTEVYVPVNGRVYQINVYGERLDDEGRKLLSDLKFSRPSRSVVSLGLPDGGDPGTYYRAGDEELIEQEEEAAREEAQEVGAAALSGSGVPVYGEKKIAEGCWRASSTFFVQTQHGMYANERWGAERTGWTKVGRPNYWDEYSHGSLGYGRCKERIYTNDKFAVDYPLDFGDAVFSPFESGKVTFAGRNYTHRDYGILVVVRADNGMYVSLSAHLSGLAPGIEPGARVTDETVIGYAGDTGGPSIPVGEPHLHQAFYRYPRYNPDGSPYGGAGLKVVFHHYVGTAAATGPGIYKFGLRSDSTTVSKGDWISN